MDYGKKENRERPADVMTLKEFLQIYNNTNRYLVDSLPDALQSQFQLPQCILCGGFTERLTVNVFHLQFSITCFTFTDQQMKFFF